MALTGPRRFYLTRRAALDLRHIHSRSSREWGDEVARRYIASLYEAMAAASENPDAGRLRQHRSTPFLMVSARKHFLVYDVVPDGIVVLTLIHQMRDIEALIAGLTPAFFKEIETYKGQEKD